MSFTLMRHKDGKATPIKLSIWDAFKGAPPPKRRPHECPQCGKFHRPGTKHESADPAGKPKSEAKNDKATKDSKSDDKPLNEHNFTAEEDAKILEMKAESTSWANIAEALGNGRTKGMVTHRFKQIKAAEAKPEEKPGGDDKKGEKVEDKPIEQMTKAEKKAYKARLAREEGLKKEEVASKEKSEATTAAGTKDPDPLQSSDPSSLPESKVDQSVIKDKQRWIAAASKHFDKTGQRITPEQARKMAEEEPKK